MRCELSEERDLVRKGGINGEERVTKRREREREREREEEN